MTTSLSWLPLIACLGIIAWSLRRWERRARVQFGPCMPPPVPKRVRASLRRRALVYALEGWHAIRRDWPVPPADGEQFSAEEVRQIHGIWMSWDAGETAPEPEYPNLTRWLEGK